MEARRVLWIGEDAGWPPDWPLKPENWRVDCVPSTAALEKLPWAGYDAIVLEFPTQNLASGALLEAVQRLAPGVPALIRNPQAPLDAVRRTFWAIPAPLGFLGIGFAPFERAVEARRTQSQAPPRQAVAEDWKRYLIGDSQPMRDVCHIIRLVGARRLPY